MLFILALGQKSLTLPFLNKQMFGNSWEATGSYRILTCLIISNLSCFECIHAIDFMHQYVLMYGQAAIIAWRFAILGDFEVDELEGQEGLNILRFATCFLVTDLSKHLA